MADQDKDNKGNHTIDCIFDINGTHTVLIKRGHWPFEGYWALPGGRQHKGEELIQTVIREMKEETGVDIRLLGDQIPAPVSVAGQQTYLDQVRTYHCGADPRGGNSTVHAIQLNGDLEQLAAYFKAGDDATDIDIFRLDDLPDLAFDHFQFIEDYFMRLKRYHNPIPAVDAIVEYNDSGLYVYVDRRGAPKGKALPGGFAKGNKSYEQTAIEEVKEETNLDIEIQGLLGVYSDPERDPRKHITSTVYIARGTGDLKFGDDAKGGGLFSLDNVPEFVFDHNRIIEDYKALRRRYRAA
jgi:ADP-ribose pyrophosphatase YjhB (NUDIX family)